MTRYAIGIGSNLGDRLDHLRRACVAIGRHVDTWQVSDLYESAPIGGPDQDPFLNAIVDVETGLGPIDLLEALQVIEHDHGRVREVRWGPRTLDLDIVTSDGDHMTTERLVIPHPRASEREFVLRPLTDVWPEAEVGGRLTAREALLRVGDQGVVWLGGDWINPPMWRGPALVTGQVLIILLAGLAIFMDGDLPSSILVPGAIVGLASAVSGAALAVIASSRLGRAMTALPEPRDAGVLVEEGPFSHVRHPIYGGTILFMVGLAVLSTDRLAMALSLALVPYFWLKSSYEERQLRIRYPAYRAYRTKVRHRLIPFIL